MLPPAEAGGNWLKQLTLKKQWQTERIVQLERQLLEANATIARQQLTIEALRERVRSPSLLALFTCHLPCLACATCLVATSLFFANHLLTGTYA